ncbi:hypothetical protein O6H91_04G127600 [Diphasiastrum complanatum]|uniref:Uncharacterized protein n=16 Tax=Diphasiastrum complanatum TaxID=34168 RepID=A0ACC2E199_DIPCM|nr:hypothetical protein O6H91_04G089700 [Diphasiastrum complanatum]KAJ7559527.1 hypothetical protein O6H91_04G089700 [Diphasiastrum complanatum]KAJ7559528.1 hypothetical protein O6H91_04G089700 [Diphasiastrum complanatum]KAJ7559529.1 hypothetical protein O6H91_04G089700 [Diphasiastrum complanatum]KAJ7559530.1 hypothetical protein O6H91_04G089700 [Diphasiastrum complanatum]
MSEQDISRWRTPVLAKSTLWGVVFTALTFLLSIIVINDQYAKSSGRLTISITQQQQLHPSTCKNETLPRGIVQNTSDLQLRVLGERANDRVATQRNLLAIAAGIKQKANVNKMVQKFPAENFTIMLFHYDGAVDKWHDLSWSHRAIHIVAMKQTKWWFAKRFLHPDIVAPYNYIFVWDEDLGVENFNASRFLAIMQEEGLEISQPALGRPSSEIHHTITVRDTTGRVHRRIYRNKGRVPCSNNSTSPPCTGLVEVMAPVFSRAAWKCFWNMIQNDLVQGWGLDFKLGYCAQGEQSEKVGVIDSEYVVHQAIPSLGDSLEGEALKQPGSDLRTKVRKQSAAELRAFTRRWRYAVQHDKCWVDPYRVNNNESAHHSTLQVQSSE